MSEILQKRLSEKFLVIVLDQIDRYSGFPLILKESYFASVILRFSLYLVYKVFTRVKDTCS